MTRFARAHGSKSSNTRVPEEATSWSVMRQQIDEGKVNKDEEDTGNMHDSNLNQLNKSSTICDSVWEVFDNRNVNKLNKKHHNIKSTDVKSKNRSEKINEKIICTTNSKITKSVKTKGNVFNINSDQKVKQSVERNEIANNETDLQNKKIAEKNYKNTNDLPFSANVVNQDMVGKRNSVDHKRKKPSINSVQANNFKTNSENATERNQDKNELTNNIGEVKLGIANKKIKLSSDQESYKPSGFVKEKKSFLMNNKERMNNISSFQGYQVKLEDADRLYKLRKDMRAKGIPRKVVLATLDAERRKAEKALARDKKSVCYNCRNYGHSMADCPELDDPRGICYKCGSTEHSSKSCRVVQGDSFKFTHCFICKEQGHISRQCPDNPRGLYPKGGACKVCGDVTHLRSDCPQLVNEKEKNRITVGTVHNNFIEDLDEEVVNIKKNKHITNKSVIKF